MSVNFEYSLEVLNDTEIRINGKRTDSFGGVWDSIIINRSWISWIITTLRTATIDDYETWKKFIKNKYDNCELMLIMNPRETDYSYLKILPFWSEEKKTTPGIEIPYLSWNKTKLMSEFIEPFLEDLSKFLSEEERNKLPKPWNFNEKDTASESAGGKISLGFVEEIDEKELLGAR